MSANAQHERRVRTGARGRPETSPIWQPSLFDEPRKESPDAAARPEARRSLDADSWVEVLPGWLADPEPLFERLLEACDWQQRERWMFDRMVTEPRLTAQVARLDDVPDPALAEAAERLSETYGVRYDHLWLNFYRDGMDSTAWHRDRFSCRRPECIVPVLSLGATRRFLLRRRAGGRSIPFTLAAGTLLVMGGRAQQDWVHSVPKAPGIVGARISVNFQSSEQGSSLDEDRSLPSR